MLTERNTMDNRSRLRQNAKKNVHVKSIQFREEMRSLTLKVRTLLKKESSERTAAEIEFLQNNSILMKQIEQRMNKNLIVKARLHEVEDSQQVLLNKCKILADAVKNSKYTVFYTGAGISTAASIPDYRGPNGVWTLLQKGQQAKHASFLDAEPTYTHMALTSLFKNGLLRHLTSQNCDGLHLRSEFSRSSLSELHGNMYIEICKNCDPHQEYIRLFDVTKSTSFRRHKTGNFCNSCNSELEDTIVHFGEKGKMGSPHNWPEASKAAEKCELIVCLGSSLKVLKKYHCLWALNRSVKQRPKLIIVNLQWTPKDESATLKINGKCDTVMREVMKLLNIPVEPYFKQNDPIFDLCTEGPFENCEVNLLTKPDLKNSFFHMKDHDYIKQYNENRPSTRSKRNSHKIPISSTIKEESSDCKKKKLKIEESYDESKPQVQKDWTDSNPGWFGKGYAKGRLKCKKNIKKCSS